MTWLIAALCVAATVRLALLAPAHAGRLMAALAVIPVRLAAYPLAQAPTLLTSVFLHAGWIHLLGNLLFLLVFAPTVERRLGPWRFLAIYLASGVVGSLAFVWTAPVSGTPLVGASGAIAGVLGAHIVLEPRSKITTLVPAVVYFEVAALPAAFVIALWFVLQVASSVAPVAAQSSAHVAWIAHIAGFVTGAVLALPLSARRRGRSRGGVRPRAGSQRTQGATRRSTRRRAA